MRNVVQKSVLLVMVVSILLVSGCSNWKKKYGHLNVEHQNLKGLYENCLTSLDTTASEKSQLGTELAQSQQTIEQLQKEIQGRNTSPADATGFTGMDVAFDARAGTITVTLPNAILFSPGKASIRKGTVSELDHVNSVLNQRYGGRGVDVVGHTDSDPIKKSKWQDNWQLSAERALAVLRYLTSRGIDPKEIRAVAAGAGSPIASNSTSSGKAKNRRVEIVVHMK